MSPYAQVKKKTKSYMYFNCNIMALNEYSNLCYLSVNSCLTDSATRWRPQNGA